MFSIIRIEWLIETNLILKRHSRTFSRGSSEPWRCALLVRFSFVTPGHRMKIHCADRKRRALITNGASPNRLRSRTNPCIGNERKQKTRYADERKNRKCRQKRKVWIRTKKKKTLLNTQHTKLLDWRKWRSCVRVVCRWQSTWTWANE